MRIAFIHEFLHKAYSNKDVVQVPLTIAKSLGCEWRYITRPSRQAMDALPRELTEFVGAEPNEFNAEQLGANERSVTYSKMFALHSGWRASAIADVYVSMFLTPRTLLGVLAYRLGRLVRLKSGFVYLKADLSQVGRSSLEEKIRERLVLRAVFRAFAWTLAKSVDLVSVETEDGRNWLARVYKTVAEKTIVVRNCAAHGSDESPSLIVRDDTIVTVGRLGAHEKAIDILLPAFRQFSAENPTWRLLLVGDSSPKLTELLTSYQDLIAQGRLNHVGYIANRQDLTRIYQTAAIFVQPSRIEGLSIALFEAIREGCLPICTPVFSVDEVFGQYSSDLTVAVDDTNALSEAFRRLVAQRDQWNEMRRYLLDRTKTWNWEEQLAPVVSAIRKKLAVD